MPRLFRSGGSTNDFFELRLVSSGDGPRQWLIGANYTKLESNTVDFNSIEGISDYIDANPAEFDGQPGSVLAPSDQAERRGRIRNLERTVLIRGFRDAATDRGNDATSRLW